MTLPSNPSGRVEFGECEAILIDTALRSPLLINDTAVNQLPQDARKRLTMKRFETGGITKLPRTGWLLFDFPESTIQQRGVVKVWTGEGGTVTPPDVFLGFFDPGVIDEDRVLLHIVNREAIVHRTNFKDSPVPADPARELLERAIEWTIGKVEDMEEAA